MSNDIVEPKKLTLENFGRYGSFVRLPEVSGKNFFRMGESPIEFFPDLATGIPAEQVGKLIEEEKLRYGLVDVPQNVLEKSFRLALALEKVVKKYDMDAVAEFDQIWLNDPRIGVIPSYGTSRLTAMGIPFT